MKGKKTYSDQHEEIHQDNHELISGCNFELGNDSSHQFLGQQQKPWNMGVWVCQPTIDQGVSEIQHLVPAKSQSSIMSRFESPASAFYATERCMGFPCQYNPQVGNPNPLSQFPSVQSYDETYSMDSSEDIRNTLQSIVKPQINNSQYCTSSEKSNPTAVVKRPLSLPFSENQEQLVSFFPQQGKLSPRICSGSVSATNGDSPSTSSSLLSKTRIRWTQELHEKFLDSVNRLGGADKATPKAILKMMALKGLTIYHIKSHLQKYRIAKYMPESAEEKLEKRISLNVELDAKTGLQITEALQLQLDVQKRLHEQLEIQRQLQLRIEEQGKELKRMFDLQNKSNNLSMTPKVDIASQQDCPSNNDTHVLSPEGSGSTGFPSKIS